MPMGNRFGQIGSGSGKKKLFANEIDFAGSDSLLTDSQFEAGTLQMLPVLMGSVVPVYKISGATQPLVLGRLVLADIYLGNITAWDDERILQDNPNLKAALNGKLIKALWRTDSSGTTEILTRALSSFSKDWNAK